MEIAGENYKIWGGGMFGNTLCSASLKGNIVEYTFYPGTALSSVQGKSTINLDKCTIFPVVSVERGVSPSDEMISEAYADALAKKIIDDTSRRSNEYLTAFLSLPTTFFTQKNCDLVLFSIMEETKTAQKDGQSITDTDGYELDLKTPDGRKELACRQFMEYANEVNPKIELGENLHSDGQKYLPLHFGK